MLYEVITVALAAAGADPAFCYLLLHPSCGHALPDPGAASRAGDHRPDPVCRNNFV